MNKIFAAFLVIVILIFSAFSVNAMASDESYTGKSSEGIVSLDGKTVVLVGNSMLYYGNCVIGGSRGEEDNGYFKQLTLSNNEDTTVIDHCYSGKALDYTYKTYLVKIPEEERKKVDYVVLSGSSHGSDDLVGDVQNIINLFPETTKFYFVCQHLIFERDIRTVIDGVEDLRKMGVEIINWGKIAYEVYTGQVQVPYAVHSFTRSSFVKENLGFTNGTGAVNPNGEGDEHHPNPLSGYVAALSIYTAITNRSAVGQAYEFTYDKSIHKYFNLSKFKSSHYNGNSTTNFDEIMMCAEDMTGIQHLINEYNEVEGRHALVSYEKGDRENCTTERTTDSYKCYCCGKVIAGHKTIVAEENHNLSAEPAYAPTCEENGAIFHYRCINKDCVFMSSDKEGKIPVKDVIIPATGHSLEAVSEIKATCEADGNTAYYRCTSCGEAFSDAEGKNRLDKVTVEKTGHNLVLKEAVAATCTEAGTKKHYGCTNEGCNAMFSDKKGQKPLFDVYVAPKGHTEIIMASSEATCTAEGLTEGLICSVCDAVTCSQNVVAKTTHNITTVIEPATLSDKGKVINKCSVCGLVESTESINAVKTVKLKITTFLYNKNKQIVDAYVTDKKGKVLKEGTDYDIEYLTDRTETGEHSVNVVLKGKYSGTKTLTYKILPGSTKRLITEKTKTTLEAQWLEAEGASGYRVILYSSKGKKIKTGYTVKNTYKFKKLTKNTKYKIKVTAYRVIDGKKVYSQYSKTITSRTLKK